MDVGSFLRLSAKLTAASREGSAFRYGTYTQKMPIEIRHRVPTDSNAFSSVFTE